MILEKPWNLQISITRGCNRLCEFCGLRGVWRKKEDRKVKFMRLDLAEEISKDLGSWLSRKRIEFALFGEPLMHPQCFDILKTMKENMKDFQFTFLSNGLNLTSEVVEELFECGVNVLVVENYDGMKQRENYIENFSRFGIHSYYENDVYPYFDVYHYHGSDIKTFVIMNDIRENDRKKPQRAIYNHGGNMAPETQRKFFGYEKLPEPLLKKCNIPFKELDIDHDGVVPVCCQDWNREGIIGKFPEDGTFKEIWNSKSFNSYRKLLNEKKRIVSPCNRCNYFGGFRVGLFQVDMKNFNKEIEISNIRKNFDINHQRGLHTKYSSFEVINIVDNDFSTFF